MDLGGFPVESIALEVRSAQFDLTVQVAEDAGRLAVSAEYNTDLFDASTIDRLLGHYRTLLDALADDPSGPVGDRPLLTDGERSQLALWNATETALPAEFGVVSLIERNAATNPDRVAVSATDGSLTYRTLNARANRLAHRLRKLGVGPDVRVAVSAERSLATVVGILAVLKAGGAYLPLDPEYPPDRLAFMIADCSAPVLLIQDHLTERFDTSLAQVVSLDADLPGDESNPIPIVGPEHLAYVIYTSGSTGAPKGVLVTRGNLDASTHARFAYYPEPIEAYLLVSSFGFDSSVAGLFWTLSQGGTLVLPAPGGQADPMVLAALIRERHVTHFLAVPSLYSVLLDNVPSEDLASLRAVIVAGESCPRDLMARHDSALTEAALYNEYGPTEATVWATVHRCLPEDATSGIVPIGRPIANTRAYLLDARMNPVPIGVTGELYLGGFGLTRGYHGRPALTADRFVPDPFSVEPGSRLYRTGDLARYRPDGGIECLGRVDDQVKIRGHRVELGEIESALLAHPSVRESAARQGSAGELVAFLVLRPGTAPSLAELRAWMSSRLPEAMVPSVFAVLDALPLLPNGKVDRGALPDPSATRLVAATVQESPRNAIEAELARLAAELLNVDRIGVLDNLFELGFDSILAIQLVARARKAGLQLTPANLFQSPSIAGLATLAVVGRDEAKAFPAPLDSSKLERLARPGLVVEEAYPLTPLQEGMLAHTLYSPGRGEYVQQLIVAVRGPLDPAALARAWRRLSDRHAVLRTGFDWPNHDRPVQAVYRGVTIPLQVIDWRELPVIEQQSRLDDALKVDRERGFNPADPPLSRLAVFRLGEESWRLVWSYHHLLFDGWSLQTILHELLTIFETEVNGRSVELPARAPFHAYIHWLNSLDPRGAEPYWRELLKGFKMPTPLGIERLATAHPGDDEEPYDVEDLILSESTTAALVDLGKRIGLTLGTVVQGAWGVLLGRYSGRDDVVFGATVSGRSAPVEGIEEMVGLLINTLPVRVSIEPDESVASWLARLQTRLVETRAYESTPLAMVQSWSEMPRGRPLFDSLVIFENYPVDDLLLRRAGGLGFGPVQVLERTHLPLTIMAFPGPQLRLRIIYETRRFEASAIDRMTGHLGCLLAAMAEGFEQPIGGLPIVSAAEARQILGQWDDQNADPRLADTGDSELAEVPQGLDRLSDEDIEAMIGEYLARVETPDE